MASGIIADCLAAMERFADAEPHTIFCGPGTIEQLDGIPEFADGCLAGMKVVIDPNLPRGMFYTLSGPKPKPHKMTDEEWLAWARACPTRAGAVKVTDCV